MIHTLKGELNTRTVWLDGKMLLPDRSQKIINHSPDGFNWGYAGSGPAQLALAVMLELTGKYADYQTFKFNLIAKLPQEDFSIIFDLAEILGEENVLNVTEDGAAVKQGQSLV